MRLKTSSSIGALHPILFFAGMYIVVLLFSIFICSTIFYSCNTSASAKTTNPVFLTESNTATASATAALK